jgi:hypothetical protein
MEVCRSSQKEPEVAAVHEVVDPLVACFSIKDERSVAISPSKLAEKIILTAKW